MIVTLGTIVMFVVSYAIFYWIFSLIRNAILKVI
jgi:cbb3-type cytochrome oxidase subunit 3